MIAYSSCPLRQVSVALCSSVVYNDPTMKLEDYFRNGKIRVHDESFAVVKATSSIPDAFAVIRDRNEITVIIDQSRIKDEEVIDIERDWKMITFDMVLPMGLVGFLARISKALAHSGVSIFAISAYSTDHILVKENDLTEAIASLKGLGFTVLDD